MTEKKYIDADSLIDLLTARYKTAEALGFVVAKDAVFQIINNLPSEKVAPVREAQWKLYRNGDAVCNGCGRLQHYTWDLEDWDNYCHHCGAKMVGAIIGESDEGNEK